MASDGVPVKAPVTRLVQGSQAPVAIRATEVVGHSLPPGGNKAASNGAVRAAHVPNAAPDLHALVALLNKHLNDSGRPNQFRVDPSAGSKQIQEINPSNGEVVGEFAATEFRNLATSLGITGLLVDSHA
jgi:hypothetical protein